MLEGLRVAAPTPECNLVVGVTDDQIASLDALGCLCARPEAEVVPRRAVATDVGTDELRLLGPRVPGAPMVTTQSTDACGGLR
jgi:Cys-tRNA synthase (O-phospho-L-seryl-tRNA:Cys-tRNA synthase)